MAQNKITINKEDTKEWLNVKLKLHILQCVEFRIVEQTEKNIFTVSFYLLINKMYHHQ